MDRIAINSWWRHRHISDVTIYVVGYVDSDAVLVNNAYRDRLIYSPRVRLYVSKQSIVNLLEYYELQ